MGRSTRGATQIRKLRKLSFFTRVRGNFARYIASNAGYPLRVTCGSRHQLLRPFLLRPFPLAPHKPIPPKQRMYRLSTSRRLSEHRVAEYLLLLNGFFLSDFVAIICAQNPFVNLFFCQEKRKRSACGKERGCLLGVYGFPVLL